MQLIISDLVLKESFKIYVATPLNFKSLEQASRDDISQQLAHKPSRYVTQHASRDEFLPCFIVFC